MHALDRPVSAFNERLASPDEGGGKFDGTAEDPYGFLYASSDDGAAVCESLLSDIPPTPLGARLLPRIAVVGRALGWIETRRELALVRLAPAFAHVARHLVAERAGSHSATRLCSP